MEQKFSLAYLTVLNTPPDEMVYMAANAGYDYVSLRPIFMGLKDEPNFSLAQNEALFSSTKKALDDTGLEVLDIELARIADDLDVRQYEPELKAAAKLGAKHVLSSIWTDDRAFYLEQFTTLCKIAAKYGLTVELEFVPIASVSTLAKAVDILETVQQPNAGLMIDMHHFHRSHEKVEDLQKLPRKWFKFGHLCDASAEIPEDKEEMVRIVREARDYVGEGGIDIASIVKSMPSIPYSIELPNKEQWEKIGYEAFAEKCLTTAKDYFENIYRKN